MTPSKGFKDMILKTSLRNGSKNSKFIHMYLQVDSFPSIIHIIFGHLPAVLANIHKWTDANGWTDNIDVPISLTSYRTPNK